MKKEESPNSRERRIVKRISLEKRGKNETLQFPPETTQQKSLSKIDLAVENLENSPGNMSVNFLAEGANTFTENPSNLSLFLKHEATENQESVMNLSQYEQSQVLTNNFV